MSDNKSRDIFYAVVAIATLVVALIGATLAYFSMTATSGEGAVSAKGAVVSVDYEDGQRLLVQSDRLIPVAFDIMQDLYRSNLDRINAAYNDKDTPLDEREKGLCQDGQNPNYDVCSVYRFTVSNDTTTTIRGTVRTEKNEFSNLYFAVRDGNCTATADNEDSCWLTLDAGSETPKAIKLFTCDNATEEACYTGDTVKEYVANALKPIFGYETGTTFRTMEINATAHPYDVVLFIREKGTAQDEDQGKAFSGNLFVETVSGQQITGQR